MYSNYNKDKEKELTSRTEQVTIAQQPAGKHRALKAYENMINRELSPNCPRCKGEDYTLEHWFLICPGMLQTKQEIFGGEEEYGLHFLAKFPARSLALAWRTLLGFGQQYHNSTIVHQYNNNISSSSKSMYNAHL